MRYIAGIDIGNSSTEVALATLNEAGTLTITHSALAETTGIKGTLRNVFGIQEDGNHYRDHHHRIDHDRP